jgi:hypothetical protein
MAPERRHVFLTGTPSHRRLGSGIAAGAVKAVDEAESKTLAVFLVRLAVRRDDEEGLN